MFDNDFTTFETVNVIWDELFGFKSCVSLQGRTWLNVKTVCKLTKSVRNYGDARNKNYVLFGNLGLTILFIGFKMPIINYRN